MAHCISIAKKFSPYNASVLIEGESGVGKELFAQSIHNDSPCRQGPFVAVNCAVLPKSLIESELFGYAEGAFTGGRKGGKAGYFELAHKGTLFLDEIGELPLDVQAQLLRVIQEKQVMRLGDTKILPVEVRLICAANNNLTDMARRALFRKDLLFRINTLSLYIPSLSKRREDIPVLADHFLAGFCKTYNKTISGFSPKAAAWLKTYHYEGTVRELRNMVERAVIICKGSMIHIPDLQSGLRKEDDFSGISGSGRDTRSPLPVSLDDAEKNHIHRVLADNNYSVTRAAASAQRATARERKASLRADWTIPSPAQRQIRYILPAVGRERFIWGFWPGAPSLSLILFFPPGDGRRSRWKGAAGKDRPPRNSRIRGTRKPPAPVPRAAVPGPV
jgi:transcriptional regulator with PAS, ATPase and Fis domain